MACLFKPEQRMKQEIPVAHSSSLATASATFTILRLSWYGACRSSTYRTAPSAKKVKKDDNWCDTHTANIDDGIN